MTNTSSKHDNIKNEIVLESPTPPTSGKQEIDTIKKPIPHIKKEKVVEAPKHNAPEQAEIDSIKKAKAKLKGK
ncbi:MAG TPA: hypothetical protein VK590_08260 [Saprospiraceae bacterium]|nr:hypothetical protein [Saprospiraceae bacterium]